MSCKYVAAAVAVFAVTAAVAGLSITVAQVETCLKLNDIDKLLEQKDVYESLEACDMIKEEERANLTIAAEAIYFIYKAVADAEYLQLDKLVKNPSKADKIHGCVKGAAAESPTPDNDQKHVGLGGKRSLGINVGRCVQSFELRTCIEDVFYSNSTLMLDDKTQKDIFMKAFDVTDAICEQTMVRADRSKSQQLMPSILVFFGTALKVLKLFACVM